ncbi:hypothetical protein AVEN_84997-1 [Araneus ventricosus]|uniref:Uncharacterized protein n=1 Tax=Araneus ventricosus TaxID=182803 RepID=A0A4Y2BYJ2_ARAVE|nr:hypothetical protein AVEN_84997-1 [Araneus ventricosus]
MTRTTPEVASPSPNLRAAPTEGRLATTCELTYTRPHTWRIFSGFGETGELKNEEALAHGSWGTWKVATSLMAARRVIAGYLVLKPAGGKR